MNRVYCESSLYNIGRVTHSGQLTLSHAIPGGLSQQQQVRQTGASTSAREPVRASHSDVRAALASDTVSGGTVDRLEALGSAMHDVGGREALRVVLEERAGAGVAIVGAIAAVLHSISLEAPEPTRRVAADGARSLVREEVNASLVLIEGIAIVSVAGTAPAFAFERL